MAELQFLDKDGVDIVAENTKTVDKKVDFASVNTLKIIVDDVFIGGTYSVTDGDELYEGNIEKTETELALLKHETTYKIVLLYGDEEAESSVTTGKYYNHYKVYFTPDTSVEKLSWAEISEIVQSGEASSYWSVGDTKSVTLNGTVGIQEFDNETYYAYILGFDHNSDIEGMNTIHWQFGYSDDDTNIAFIDLGYSSSTGSGFVMNTSDTSYGGWESSYMRNTICSQFLEALPDDLQSAIKRITKYTDNVGNRGGHETANVTGTRDKIFLLNCYEVLASALEDSYANMYESNYTQTYDYYVAGNSCIKYQHTSTSSICQWWLRSPDCTNSIGFCTIYSDGNFSTTAASYGRGFAPAFVI